MLNVSPVTKAIERLNKQTGPTQLRKIYQGSSRDYIQLFPECKLLALRTSGVAQLSDLEAPETSK